MAFLIDSLSQRASRWAVEHRWFTVGVGLASLADRLFLTFSGIIGAEFLPHLDEGAIWARGEMANSTSLTEGNAFRHPMPATSSPRSPKSPRSSRKSGAPDDGTDTGGFGNTEYFVDLKPKEQWRPVFHQDKDELIAAMNREVSEISRGLLEFLSAH